MLIGTLNTVAEPLNASELRARMQGSDKDKKASADRLKLMRDGKNQVGMLNERALFYELPSGKRVQAILLPSGKRSPAITEKGVLVPACLTTRNTLVAGEYNPQTKSIVCNIPAAEIAYIDDELYMKDENEVYSEKGELREYDEQGEFVAKTTINKYANKQSKEGAVNRNKTAQKTPAVVTKKQAPVVKPVVRPDDFYMPSTSQQGGKADVAVISLTKEKPYGIQRGTWVDIKLGRSVSSGDSGQAEFFLEDDIAGSYQTLPAGTVFFANKQINMSTKRMEAFATLAKLPNGKEIKVQGWVYSLNQTAGLSGVLERDREGENEAATGNAALASLGAAASTVGGAGSVAGAAVDSYTGEMVSNERRYSNRAPAATIRVSPQRALLQFTEPF